MDIKPDPALLSFPNRQDFILESPAFDQLRGEPRGALLYSLFQRLLSLPETTKQPYHNEVERQDDGSVPDRSKASGVMLSGQETDGSRNHGTDNTDQAPEKCADVPSRKSYRHQIEHRTGNLVAGQRIDCGNARDNHKRKANQNRLGQVI